MFCWPSNWPNGKPSQAKALGRLILWLLARAQQEWNSPAHSPKFAGMCWLTSFARLIPAARGSCCSRVALASCLRTPRTFLTALKSSFAQDIVLLKFVGLLMPLRANAQEEMTGLDVNQHGEEAYIHGEGMGSGR